MIGYDKIPEHEDILLDLPLSEGDGIVVRDQAKPHHQSVDINEPGGGSYRWARALTENDNGFDNGFDWGYDAKIGIGCLEFVVIGNGAGDGIYLDLTSAESLDLDFIAGDYSFGAWVNITDTSFSQILIGRYTLDSKGWEIYWTKVGVIRYISQRHHHAATLVPPVTGNPRSGCYSVGWNEGIWCFLGISRVGGGEGFHYKNGVALTMTTGGLLDPETSNNSLVIGARFTKDSNWFKGKMSRPRVWSRALSATEWLNIFNRECDYFGV